jgi:tripartite-type tricarboxylate transporter receptor subunit TctC
MICFLQNSLRSAQLSVALVGALLGGLGTLAHAEFPERAVTIVVPYPVGGATDTLSRLAGTKMGEVMGASFVVENRSGGSGMIGLNAVAHLPADGHTMVLGSVADIAIFTAASPTAPAVNFVKDFSAVGGIAAAPHILVVPSTLAAQSMEQLIALLKKAPGKHNFASIGVGTLSHLEGNLLMQTTGVDIVHVPYRGGAQALQELSMGNSSLMFLSGPNAILLLSSGKVRILAAAANQRLAMLPTVPTFTESGIKGFNAPNRFGFFVLKGTPLSAIEKLSSALAQALESTDLRSRLENQGMIPQYVNASDYNRETAEDFQFFNDIVKKSKIRLE